MTISWCAVNAYVYGLLAPPLGGPLWHRELLGLQTIASSWAGLATCGVVVLSAVLVLRWPLPALGLLLAATIAAASAPQPVPTESIACFLIPPAGIAVGFIAATRPRAISIAAVVIALGVLARYGTNWRGAGLPATPGRRPSSSRG
jgi:hypothetical protein